MVRVKARGEEIRRFILENVEKHSADISKLTEERFRISRQAVNKHLQLLISGGSLLDSGSTRDHSYVLATISDWTHKYSVTPTLSEGDVWAKDVRAVLEPLKPNAMDIWQYGFTEMFNNAYDHSASNEILVSIEKNAILTKMIIIDYGVGIFKKIQKALNLLDERHSLLELAKGKFTTDPTRHTGEGIFFTSRMFDSFDIRSGNCFFTHSAEEKEDWFIEADPSEGTAVFMELNDHTSRTAKEIFDQFSSGEDFGFTKTVIPVRMALYGDDKLISRSQAKRVLARIESFKKVVLDFKGVETIGHSFADEIFRVFAQLHPDIEFTPIFASEDVAQMIQRAQKGALQSASAMAEAESKPPESSADKT